MTFAQLRALVAVARHGSFSAAADSLLMSPSSVGHAVRALERELGVELLSRDADGAHPTPAGRAALKHADRLLGHSDSLRREARLAGGKVGRRLRVGAVPSASGRLMRAAISALERRLPEVEIAVLEGADHEVLDWLDTSAVDVAVAGSVEGRGDGTPIGRDEVFAVVPLAHRLAEGDKVAIEQLAEAPFLMSTGGCEPLILALAHERGLDLQIRHDIHNVDALAAMTADGLGVTVVPALALPRDMDGLRALPLDPPAFRTLEVFGAGGDAAPAVAELVEELGGKTGVAELEPIG